MMHDDWTVSGQRRRNLTPPMVEGEMTTTDQQVNYQVRHYPMWLLYDLSLIHSSFWALCGLSLEQGVQLVSCLPIHFPLQLPEQICFGAVSYYSRIAFEPYLEGCLWYYIYDRIIIIILEKAWKQSDGRYERVGVIRGSKTVVVSGSILTTPFY